jgi:hypothetical protein
MNRCYHAAKSILLGLLAAQVLATFQVYLSNLSLHRKVISIRDAGYLAVPNQQITESLQSFGPAFFGGLFFTLTIGAGLSLVSFAVAWVWDRVASRYKGIVILFAVLWAACLVSLNLHGLNLGGTLYFLVIPPLVCALTLRWDPAEDRKRVRLNRMVHLIPIVLLALLWRSEMDSRMFLDVRDYLLLSNPMGRRINDFYYKYTLYPAEVFKSLDQKTLRTCSLVSLTDEHLVCELDKALLDQDYLTVRGDDGVDLKMVQEGNMLTLKNDGQPVVRVTPQAFLASPKQVLKQFSVKSDRLALFRQVTFFCLLVAFPVTLYMLLYALFCIALHFFWGFRVASVTASAICLLFGIALLVPVHVGRGKEIDVNNLAEVLESERWQDRVVALKIMGQKRIELGDFQAYQEMLVSPHVPERYWLARALAVSQKHRTYEDLLTLLDDPHPNVVSMAFYALGQRGNKRAVSEIINRIEVSNDWYNQWYAYRALRNLGWKQERLTQRF